MGVFQVSTLDASIWEFTVAEGIMDELKGLLELGVLLAFLFLAEGTYRWFFEDVSVWDAEFPDLHELVEWMTNDEAGVVLNSAGMTRWQVSRLRSRLSQRRLQAEFRALGKPDHLI